MPNIFGRFDIDDDSHEEDPLSLLLLRASKEVQNGAIIGFFVGAVIGGIAIWPAITVNWLFFLITVGLLIIGLMGGAAIGKVIEVRRTLRRRARKEKREAKEGKRKKGTRREFGD
jgi:hypothetical protein